MMKVKPVMKFKYYTDPGHGWVAVKRALLEELGITNQITAFSYEQGQTVYLEEDCDAGVLIKTLENQGTNVELVQRNTNNRSPIRSYQNFQK
jgi:hypothetical protein